MAASAKRCGQGEGRSGFGWPTPTTTAPSVTGDAGALVIGGLAEHPVEGAIVKPKPVDLARGSVIVQMDAFSVAVHRFISFWGK
jgi:hypothetical protein